LIVDLRSRGPQKTALQQTRVGRKRSDGNQMESEAIMKKIKEKRRCVFR
jgi:hypothetical protein